jgi:hypothetical protein
MTRLQRLILDPPVPTFRAAIIQPLAAAVNAGAPFDTPGAVWYNQSIETEGKMGKLNMPENQPEAAAPIQEQDDAGVQSGGHASASAATRADIRNIAIIAHVSKSA